MRLQHHIDQRAQGIRNARLIDKNIKACTGDGAVAQGSNQRWLINLLAACDIDQIAIGAQCLEYRWSDDCAALIGRCR